MENSRTDFIISEQNWSRYVMGFLGCTWAGSRGMLTAIVAIADVMKNDL